MGYPETKIQLSLKVRVIEDLNCYFGYTQLMMWGLFHSFKDLNYNPEFFYRFTFDKSTNRWLDIGPYEHVSNGMSGMEKRAWNRTYIRYYETFRSTNTFQFAWSLKAWVPYWYKPATEGIPKYNGLWEAEFTLLDFLSSGFDNSELMFRVYPGGPMYINPLSGGQELTFQFKIRKMRFLPLFSFQFFHGYGESLLNFKNERYGIRAGLALKIDEL